MNAEKCLTTVMDGDTHTQTHTLSHTHSLTHSLTHTHTHTSIEYLNPRRMTPDGRLTCYLFSLVLSACLITSPSPSLNCSVTVESFAAVLSFGWVVLGAGSTPSSLES